jgi:Mg2+/Co2+ transporter CorB
MDRMLNKMKAIHDNAKKKGSKVIIATARSDFDNKEKFLDAFRKHGVDIDNIHVHRAGNDKGEGTVAEKKARIISNQLKAGNYKRATLYDDSKENLKHFLALKKDHPDVQFKAYHVLPDGSTTRHHEE